LYPSLAYPTYGIGAKLCGAASAAVDVADSALNHGALDGAPASSRLLWVNSPVSVLHPSVRGDSLDGVLAVFSLSKRSNLAGYRAGLVTGDPALMKDLLLVGRQAGMIVPAPVQAAMIAALSDDAHADEQKARYAARRGILVEGLTAAGFRIEHSAAGLYLWATRPGLDCWAACELLAAECGILVGPGSMYGPEGSGYIRVALTATDERVGAAGTRFAAFAS